MKIKVYNQLGQIVGDHEVSDEIFAVGLNNDLLHQVVVSQMANKRQGNAHSKDRGEVRGGGKKPWRQKGTGRARHGSTRSPIWKGGGVTFGPNNEKKYGKTIPLKMKKKALCMVLSEKNKNGLLILLDNLEMQTAKTKILAETLLKLPCKDESSLIVCSAKNPQIVLSARNIPFTKTSRAIDLNALDVLNRKYLLLPTTELETIEKRLLKNNSSGNSICLNKIKICL